MPAHREPDRRTLTIPDAMLLIACTAIGIAAYRAALRPAERLVPLQYLVTAPARWTPEELIGRVATFTVLALCLVGGWTIALPALRLRRPRPAWRRLVRQPGMMACVSAILGMAWGAAVLAGTISIAWATQGRLQLPLTVWITRLARDELLPQVGLSVAVAWTVQVVIGSWRPEPDWIDRVGRVLGCLWVVNGFIWGCRYYLPVL